MEKCAAVMGKRLKEFVEISLTKTCNNIYHLVDSSMVLVYVHKEDSKLKPYEGVRVAEIQTANEQVDGRLLNWA